MDELLTMSKRELTRLESMPRIKDKRLTQKEAAEMLGLSIRQIKRRYRASKTQGAQELVSGRRWKPSNHRKKALAMAQTNWTGQSSLSLWAKSRPESKAQNQAGSAFFSALCQRSGHFPAFPYPLHAWLEVIRSNFLPFILGHFCFAEMGPFLFFIDRPFQVSVRKRSNPRQNTGQPRDRESRQSLFNNLIPLT